MKKTYKTVTAFLVLLSMISLQMGAQLSGVYTINNGSPTSGSNFNSFNAFASALGVGGVNGPVTVNVVANTGPYVEQVAFNTISGVSATNTITINGNGNLLTFASNSSANYHTLKLQGADRMFFHNLQVRGTGTYAWTLIMTGGADDNLFSSCTFSVNANTNTSLHIPVLFSGAANSQYNTGISGSRNTFDGCDFFSGYCNLWMYGTTSTRPTDNSFTNCNFLDFYYFGIYNYYGKNLLFKNNIIERPTRTNFTSYTYSAYMYYNEGLMFDGNILRRMYEQNKTYYGYWYGIFGYYNTSGGASENVIQNNIISEIEHAGYIYGGIYYYYIGGKITHNTISLDDANANSSGITYGIYTYGPSPYNVDVTNNMVSITRSGSGTKYGLYYPSSGVTSSNNNIYINASGTTYLGYYNGTINTIAAFNSAGLEQNSLTLDPQFANLANNDFEPTNTSLNNLGKPMGVFLDQENHPRSGSTPDIGAIEFLSTPCSGAPNPGSVVTPTYQLCPGENANVILSNFSSDLGITYQWYASTQTSVGLFVAIPNATTVMHSAKNMTINTWYQAVVTCTNTNQSSSPVGYVEVAGTTTSTVPYHEGFENVGKTNRLPNCSWTADNLGSSALVYTSSATGNRVPNNGTSFASFYYTPYGTNAFYTNGIWLNAGITYSASLWYTTEYYGYDGWDLSILVGQNQSTTGQQLIVEADPAISNIYKSLSNTFTVATSGLYYVAIEATSSSYGQYLSWDDLRIEIPCSHNSPTVNVSTSQATVCANQPVTLQASGADTYLWSTGDQTDIVTTTPVFPGQVTYYVTGTNTLTNCELTKQQMVMVNPAPNLNVFANPPSICIGESTNLHAFGAMNYIWSSNGTGNMVSVTPSAAGSKTYAVVGSNQYNCQGSAVVTVNVNGLPLINVQHPAEVCPGEAAQIIATGGVSYEFISSNSYNTSNPAFVTPATSTQYTVMGTDANGCESAAYATIAVLDCTGLNEFTGMSGVRVYPNPTAGEFNIEVGNTADKMVEIVDVTGRVLVSENTNSANIGLDIRNFANGIYYVKIKSQDAVEVIRIIKD